MRTKNSDRITVSLPKDLAKAAHDTAKRKFQPISNYIAELIWKDTIRSDKTKAEKK